MTLLKILSILYLYCYPQETYLGGYASPCPIVTESRDFQICFPDGWGVYRTSKGMGDCETPDLCDNLGTVFVPEVRCGPRFKAPETGSGYWTRRTYNRVAVLVPGSLCPDGYSRALNVRCFDSDAPPQVVSVTHTCIR